MYINSVIRILEIPLIILSKNTIPFIKFKVELPSTRNNHNSLIVEAQIWGDLAYHIKNYHHVNDYLIIEGYFYTDTLLQTSIPNLEVEFVKLDIYQIYPIFIKNLENRTF